MTDLECVARWAGITPDELRMANSYRRGRMTGASQRTIRMIAASLTWDHPLLAGTERGRRKARAANGSQRVGAQTHYGGTD